MLYEAGNPDMTFAEWERFCTDLPLALFDEVIERDQLSIHDWGLPLARGAVVASDQLLQKVGYRPNSRRPSDWRPGNDGHFWKPAGNDHCVVVAPLGSLWTIERRTLFPVFDGYHYEILVSSYGALPVLTRTVAAGMRLAEFAHEGCPAGLQWIDVSPDDPEVCKAAVTLVKARRNYEAIVRDALNKAAKRAAATADRLRGEAGSAP
jgi:hypothetical protein